MWWFATTIVVVAYAILINRFFNPDANSIIILMMLVLACGYAATRSTLSVMFVVEIGLIVNAPIIIFVLFKAVRSTQLNWDAIHVVANYVTEMPTLTCIAAASFVFTGYINLSLFNRLFPPNFRFKFRFIYPLFGVDIMLITFFVPIGFHGTEGVNQYIYIWSLTADSLLMQYGFIERVLFLFSNRLFEFDTRLYDVRMASGDGVYQKLLPEQQAGDRQPQNTGIQLCHCRHFCIAHDLVPRPDE